MGEKKVDKTLLESWNDISFLRAILPQPPNYHLISDTSGQLGIHSGVYLKIMDMHNFIPVGKVEVYALYNPPHHIRPEYWVQMNS